MLLFLLLRLRFSNCWRKVQTSESYKNKHNSKKTYVVTARSTTSTTTEGNPAFTRGYFLINYKSQSLLLPK